MKPEICKKGHWYDAEKMWLGCPYCEGGAIYVCPLCQHVHEPGIYCGMTPPGKFTGDMCVCTGLGDGTAKEAVRRTVTVEAWTGPMSVPVTGTITAPKIVLPRPNWDTIWMDFASALALRSTCSRSSVGCVVVSTDNSTVMGLGYNGGPKGGNNACLSDEPGKCGHLHAEINALLKANYRDAASRKAYLTLSPCLNCATALVNFGVEEVIYRDAYRDLSPLKILADAKVAIRQFPETRVPERDLYLNKDRP